MFVVVLVEVVDVPVVVVVVPGGTTPIDALCPGRMPRFLILSSRASSTCTWITTSGLALSISLIIFSAIASLSGVSRMMIAFCAFNCCSRFKSSNCRSPVTISVRSCACTVFDK